MTRTVHAPPAGSQRLLEMVPPGEARLGFAAHTERYGPLLLRGYGGPRGPKPLIDMVARADLRGRGGASFPLAVKLRTVAERRRGSAYVLVNGGESEPPSHKDALLLCRVPHLVLDGAVLAADAVGAHDVHIVAKAGGPHAAVAAALAERDAGPVRIRLHTAPTAYVATEESALIGWLDGGKPLPTFSPPPAVVGLRGRPTVVNNVETLAHLALIARYGADWYRQVGAGSTRGTLLLTVGGSVARPGVLEVAFGTRLGDVLRPAEPSGRPAAVLVGGWFGAWLPMPRAAEVALDPAELAAAGTGVGAGVLHVLAADDCGLRHTAEIVWWLAGQNAGQCGPCFNGLPAIAAAMSDLAAGRATQQLLTRLHRWCDLVTGRGACHHPDGVARLVRSALRVFADDVRRHERGQSCPPPRGARS